MGKTVFQDGNKETGTLGTRVMAAFLNAIFKHRHDGLDQDGSAPINYAVDSGEANAYVIALNPMLTANVAGMQIIFKAGAANTGAATLNINGLGAVAIRLPDGSPLLPGDIPLGGMVSVVWDGTYYIMLTMPSNSRNWPIGTYYYNHDDNRNPALILGFGTWLAVQGKFILGVSGTYLANTTGGEATHILSTAEMPTHQHIAPYTEGGVYPWGVSPGPANGSGSNDTDQDYAYVSPTGGGLAHNNMPPFETAYAWRRTA